MKQSLPGLSRSSSHRRWRQSVAPGVRPGIKYPQGVQARIAGDRKTLLATDVPLLKTVTLYGNQDARRANEGSGHSEAVL